MRVEFLIDMVQMVPQSLQRNPQFAGNFYCIFTDRKHLQDLRLLFRKWGHGQRPTGNVWNTGQLSRKVCHLAEKFLVLFPLGDVMSKVHDQTPMVPGVFIYKGRHAHPHPTPGTDLHFQVKVWDFEVPCGIVTDAAIVAIHLDAQGSAPLQKTFAALLESVGLSVTK